MGGCSAFTVKATKGRPPSVAFFWGACELWVPVGVWCSCFHLAYRVPGRRGALGQWVPRTVFIDSLTAHHNMAHGFGGDGGLCGACCTQIMPGDELAVGCFGGDACNARYCDRGCRKRVAVEHAMLCKVRGPRPPVQPWLYGRSWLVSGGRLAFFTPAWE